MAVVLVIVALLIAGMLLPLSAQQEIRGRQETEKTLSDIREAIIGYAASHFANDGKPYLPCPDKTADTGDAKHNDGVEDRSGGSCEFQEGNIPWVTLGLGRNDAWNNRFHYRVTPTFSNSAAGFTLSTPGDITICADSTACAATAIASTIPAIVLSYGPNGFGAINTLGGTNAAPTGADELENTNADGSFVSKTPAPAFDDLVVWVPATVLINRMITAGKLP
jgi:type II secretory pathway pseudopilin PulG